VKKAAGTTASKATKATTAVKKATRTVAKKVAKKATPATGDDAPF
jgi:hypothetical protein